MIIELLTFGDELLDGRRVDTNTAWLGRQFTALGYPPRFRQTVSDRMQDIVESYVLALDRSDFILSTGGLGPTADDITFEALAKAVGKKLVFHPDIYEKIQKRFSDRGLHCTNSNKRQAMLPEGSIEIPNDWGTAPGLKLQVGKKIIFALPGVPSEMENLFKRGVEEEFKSRTQGNVLSTEKIYKFCGMAESHVEEAIDRCKLSEIPGAEFRIAYTASFPQIDVTLSVSERTKGELEKSLQEGERRILAEIGDHLAAMGSQTLEGRLISELKTRNRTLSIAESMTGGLVSSQLINAAGASDVIKWSVVTYSNESKVSFLGVSPDTLKNFGAVSEQCVLEMARGAKRLAQSDYAIATTGIAGPDGGSDEKPVGLTYVAWVGPNLENEKVRRYQFRWDRNRNRMMATYETLMGLFSVLAED